MGKPTICIGENKGADQLHSNCEADQRLCFRYSDGTMPLLLKSEISSFRLFSVLVQVGLCQTCLETTLLAFPRDGSFVVFGTPQPHYSAEGLSACFLLFFDILYMYIMYIYYSFL